MDIKTKAEVHDMVIFTEDLLLATLDPNGNTPFTQDDVGKIFFVHCAYIIDGIEHVHLVNDGITTRSIPLSLIIWNK